MNFFNTKLHNTTIKRELMTGFSTFISMSYILSLNPKMLSMIGMDYDGVFMATIIATVLTTVFSAIYTKMPVAYAPAVSYNLLFIPMMFSMAGEDWQLMLLATYLSGILLILLVISGLYELIYRLIPDFIKYSLVGGIGLAVAITGMKLLHLVEMMNGEYSLTIQKKEVIYCIIALVIALLLKRRERRYAIALSVFITYGLIVLVQGGISLYQNQFSLSRLFGNSPTYSQFHPGDILKVSYRLPRLATLWQDKSKLVHLAILVIAMTLTHFVDACGTGIVMAEEIRRGDMNFTPNAEKKIMLTNGVGALISACAGTLPVTTYGESMIGIDAGARTGLSAIIVSLCFVLSGFFAPFYKMMSGYIVAPAMLYVGYLFLRKIKRVKFRDYREKLTAAFIIGYGGMSFQIGEALIWGGCLYIVLQLVTGKKKEITKWWPVVATLSLICAIIHCYS